MFEIGFLELALLCVIALLVVGPSRLPGLVRTVGVWVGRAQRLVSQVRADIEREVRADELRKAAKEYSPTAVISDVKKEVEDLANEVSKPVDLDAKKAEPEKSEKAEAAESVPEKPEAGKAEAKVPEAGKPESSDGAAAAVTAPADAVAPEEADGAGAEDPEPTERPAGDVSAPETAANAQPEASEPAPDSEPADGGTDRAAAPAVTGHAETPPADADERHAAA